MISRLGLPLVVSLAQLCAAALALGPPDVGAAGTFLAGGWPTVAGTQAALELLVWAVVIAAIGWSVVSAAREVGRRAAASERFREASALVAGLLILVAGAVHHLGYQVGMSGGSVQEAQRVLGH